MKMKNELLWWITFGLISTLTLVLLTGFQFYSLDFQVYNTYYVVESTQAIQWLIFVMGMGRYVYQLISIMVERYRMIALLIAIVNPIGALFVSVIIFLGLKPILAFNREPNFAGHYFLLLILGGILIMQIIIEVKMIRKLWVGFSVR
jgi:hypothetical protein